MAADNRAPVTVLGLGPMGRALAGAFLDNGHPTTVWNRTASRAESLVARGATLADTPADAVAASPLAIVCVIDYDAVHAIVDPAAGALKGRTLVNLTADTPERARRTAAWAAAHGVDYLDGAVMTPTTTIGGPAAVVLYSGPEEIYRTHEATLASLGGGATHLGADPGRAAAHDVALLDLFWTSMSGLVHAFALAAAEGVRARELAPFAKGISALLPDIMESFAQQVDDGRHPGDQSTVLSAAAGMEHIIHAARARGIDTGVLSAASAVARRAIDAGHGEDGFSRLAEVLTNRG
ncbi:NAD(P)-dependent oxidoreductase [Streptosporangium carneum]|uniref:6-phosphogluconate dehydrogenase n=1 Tax=Streptosporangium carneum TaxID=47481 RepID=A0A9W6MHU8_9ACTN|nr:NAD(P)-binding domain-containing protein [Streptosporangium carneum]GLK14323.1 6-phosphogluconate dehydrogenase [Streptosporangium carneum]